MYSPLEQFKVIPNIRLFNLNYDLTISNHTIFNIISILISIYIIYNTPGILSNKREIISKLLYIRIENIIREMLGKTKYIPLIYSIFIMILINNIIGLIPYSYTITSHIIYTIYISSIIIIGTTYIGIVKHKLNFYKLFIPSGLTGGTIYIIPLIFIIEIISYISRIISLSVRLTANMISGHLLLHIITNFGIHLSIYLLVIPILLLLPIYILEFAVCIIQSYVFTILIISYIKDVEYLH